MVYLLRIPLIGNLSAHLLLGTQLAALRVISAMGKISNTTKGSLHCSNMVR